MMSESSPTFIMHLSREGYEILQQQWIHLIVIVYYYNLSCVERLPQIWQVGCNLGVDLNNNGMM